MPKNKNTRIIITLECEKCSWMLKGNVKKVSRYYTEKNKRNNPERLSLNKYCANCKKLTKHTEIK